MALIYGGTDKDYLGRPVPFYIDTDDLDDPEYHYLRLAEEMQSVVPGASKIYRDILCGRLTAREIESNAKYSWMTDEVSLLVLRSKKLEANA